MKYFISWVEYDYYNQHYNMFYCDIIHEHPLKWLEQAQKKPSKAVTLLWWKELP